MSTQEKISDLKRIFKIVIADDNKKNVELLKQQLEQCGYKVVCCYSGSELLKVAKIENPDLVLLDIMMPNLNGYEACRLLKDIFSYKFLPVILFSVKSDPESRIEGYGSGANDYIVKPYDFQELKIKVHNVLEVVQSNEDSEKLRQYYNENRRLLSEIELLMKSLKYSLAQVEKGKEGDLSHALEQIASIEERVKKITNAF